MNRDEIRKLLGGYATGTLTESERELLFAAALEDQELFNALADEEALRGLLADTGYRRELAAALRETPSTVGERITAWWRRPLPWALAGAAATVTVALLVLLQPREPEQQLALSRQAPALESFERTPPPEVKPAATTPPKMEAGAGRVAPVKPGSSALAEPERSAAPQAAAPPAPVREQPERARPDESVTGERLGRAEQDRSVEQPVETARAKAGNEAPAAQPDEARPAEQRWLAAVAGGARGKTAPAAPAATEEQPAPPRMADEGLPPVTIRPDPERKELGVATALRQQQRPATFSARPGGQLRIAAPSVARIAVAVEQRTARGDFRPVFGAGDLSRSDVVRLRAAALAIGYVYVIEVPEPGRSRLIYTAEAESAKDLLIPETGGLPPPARPGERLLYIVFSETPLDLGSVGVYGSFRREDVPSGVEVILRYRD